MPRRIRPSLAALLLLSACRSPQAWSHQADEEVYPILTAERAALGATDEFTLARAQPTLRDELVAQARGRPLELDLVACLQVAAENSRDWQDQRELLFRSALDLTLARWNFAVQEQGTLGVFLSGSGSAADQQGFTSNLNLFRLLGLGTSLSLDAGIDLVRSVGRGEAWDAISHFTLNITQPILRGFGAEIVREPLTQAERDVLYQARAYERFRRTFAFDVAQRFFRTLERVDRLANEQANRENLTRLRERNEALAEAGRLTDIQVDQARQDEFSAEDRLVTAQRDLEGALDDLKFTLGLPIETELTLSAGGQRALGAWPMLEEELPEEEAVRVGLAQRLDHATACDRVVDAERGVRVAADALRLGLDLTGRLDLASEGQADRLRFDDAVWNLNLDLDLPIDRIPERNTYRAAEIALAARQRDLAQSTDQVTSDLRDALRRLEAARASYRIQSGSVALAERRVESAALNLDAGRASTRDVLEAQESLLSAQNTAASALTDTILAGLSLYRDMELLEVTPRGLEVLPVPQEVAQP